MDNQIQCLVRHCSLYTNLNIYKIFNENVRLLSFFLLLSMLFHTILYTYNCPRLHIFSLNQPQIIHLIEHVYGQIDGNSIRLYILAILLLTQPRSSNSMGIDIAKQYGFVQFYLIFCSSIAIKTAHY